MKIEQLLADIHQIRPGVIKSLEQTSDVCVQLILFEYLYTLNMLEAMLNTATVENLESGIKDLLVQRGARAAHRYTQDPHHPVNRLCLTLATALSPLPSDPEAINDLPLGAGPYFLLMPNLKAHQDAISENIHQLSLHEFILSDKEDLFIPLEFVLNQAVNSDEGKFKQVVNFSNAAPLLTSEYPLLTSSELLRLSAHSVLAQEYYDAVLNYNRARLYGAGLGPQLQQLVIALRAGGVKQRGQKGGGEEYNAGAAANEGIVKFTIYWQSLPPKLKKIFYRQHPELEEIIDRLMRPTHANYRSSAFCVEIIANQIAPIISQRNQSHRPHQVDVDFTIDLTKILQKKQKAFLTEVKKEHFPHLPIASLEANFLSWFSSLNEDHKNTISESPTYQAALHYILQQELSNLPNLIELVQNLLTKGASLNYRDQKGNNPLDLAISLRDPELIKFLLIKAIELPQKEQVTLLQKQEQAANSPNSVLHYAANKYPEILHTLLIAAEQHHAELLPEFLASNQNLVQTLLTQVAKAGNEEALTLLLRLSANHNIDIKYEQYSYVLQAAARDGHSKIIKTLLQIGTNLYVKEAYDTNIDVIRSIAINNKDKVLMKTIWLHMLTLPEKAQQTFLQQLSWSSRAHAKDYERTPSSYSAWNRIANEYPELLHIFLEGINKGAIPALLGYINDYKETALHATARANNTEAALKLIEFGCRLDVQDPRGSRDLGKTALHWAIINKNRQLSIRLLEKGADITKRYLHDHDFWDRNITRNALDEIKLALEAQPFNNELKEILKHLLLKALTLTPEQQEELLFNQRNTDEYGFCISAYKDIWMYAAEFCPELLDSLLAQAQAQPIAIPIKVLNSYNSEGYSLLYLATRAGNKEAVIQLLQLGAKITLPAANWFDGSPLSIAINLGHTEIVRILLERGATLFSANYSIFYRIVACEPSEIMKILLLKAISLTPEEQLKLLQPLPGNYNNLWIYIAEKSPLLLDSLLEQTPEQATPNILSLTNKNGASLLILAAKAGNVQAVNQLLALGADIRAQDNAGMSAIHYAISLNNIPLLEALLQKEPDLILLKNTEDEHALDLAIKQQPTLINYLLQKVIASPLEILMNLTTKTTKKNIFMLVFEFCPDLMTPLFLNIETLPEEQKKKVQTLFNRRDDSGKTIWLYALRVSKSTSLLLLRFAQKLDLVLYSYESVKKSYHLENLNLLVETLKARKEKFSDFIPLLFHSTLLHRKQQEHLLAIQKSQAKEELIVITEAEIHKTNVILINLITLTRTLDPSFFNILGDALSDLTLGNKVSNLKIVEELLTLTNRGQQNCLMLALTHAPSAVPTLLRLIATLPIKSQVAIFQQTSGEPQNVIMLALRHNIEALPELLSLISKLPEAIKDNLLLQLFTQEDSEEKAVFAIAATHSLEPEQLNQINPAGLLFDALKDLATRVNIEYILRTIKLDQLQNTEQMLLVLQLRAQTKTNYNSLYPPFSCLESKALKTAQFSVAESYHLITEKLLHYSQIGCSKSDMLEYLTETIPEGETRKAAIRAILMPTSEESPLKQFLTTSEPGFFGSKKKNVLKKLEEELLRLESISEPDASAPDVFASGDKASSPNTSASGDSRPKNP